ncbi:glycosyltransferase [Pseudarthrobacter oxydans]|uniref:glycosyltransferase family 4 protein n=1 Tax=Pseudarthrobacter oxydans TaxID=1671 RepID=UPI003ED16992
MAIIVAYVYGPKKLVHSHTGIKGHDILLEAWRAFSQSKEDVRLLLVGGGFDAFGRAHRLALMEQYRNESTSIRWIENVEDVSRYYWASDISVSPSLSENHGAALEAGACGVARIVSDAGGLPETTSSLSGWVVPKGDAEQLRIALEESYREFQSGALAKRAEASRSEVVEKFDSAASASSVVDILEGALPATKTPVVSLISEARLGRSKDGALAAVDAASGPTAWKRYQNRISGFRLAARVSEVPGSASILLNTLPVFPLPHYIGIGQFMRNIPSLLRNCWKLVSSSDVVVVRIPGPLGFLNAVLANLLRKPLLVEVVGDPETVLRDHPSRMVRMLALPAKHVMRYCVRSASASRFVTEKMLQSIYPPRSDAPTLSMSNVQLNDDDFSSTYTLPIGTKWRLTAIGSQETNYKGHDLAIEAISALRDRGYECELLLVGQGSLHAELAEQARALNVQDLVRFQDGFSERRELWKILDNTDVFIHPSRSEGLPRVVIEAMARSRPVIASRIGGIPELVAAEFLVRSGDSSDLAERIARLVDDPSVAKEASVTNYAVAQRYRYAKLELVFDEWCRLIAEARRQRCSSKNQI